MTIEVLNKLSEVKIFPGDELEEIAQNVAMILSTMLRTVPFDRSFGVDGNIIDQPMATAQAKLTAAFAVAIREQEPRARVKKVTFSGDPTDGTLLARAQIEIVEKNLRGG